MKLTIIGGAGVRTPFMIAGLAQYAPRIDLQEVWLMDIHAEKLDIIGGLCQSLAKQHNVPFTLHLSTEPREALMDADHVITTIRVGGETGRVQDERIALQHGVIGQETTGPGGFAMAMRSIPAILKACELIDEIAPRAWVHNFTNPAGLVTQALIDVGFTRIIGICDSANTAQHHVASYLGVAADTVETEVFGLNHLSWTRAARVAGQDRLPELLRDPTFINTCHMHLFDEALREYIGMFLNEYLYYYYYRDKMLAKLQGGEETRGEEIARLTQNLLEQLRALDNVDDRLRTHAAIMAARSATYMGHAEKPVPQAAQHDSQVTQPDQDAHALGYAGVTLECIEAIQTGTPHRTGLNVPNAGAIAGLGDDDVVEVTCIVDATGPHPIPIGEIPEHQYLLTRTVKYYERIAASAILNRNRDLAVEALFAHPLVASFSLAQTLVDEYLAAHRAYLGEWG
jgi:6-phospho-beta-glucosidase